jgi:hypothetical protein
MVAHAGTAGVGEGDGLGDSLGDALGLGEPAAEADADGLGVPCVDATGVVLPQAATSTTDAKASAPTLRLSGIPTRAIGT